MRKRQINPPEPLNLNHDVSDFQSASVDLNDWLKDRALKSAGDTARTYIANDLNLFYHRRSNDYLMVIRRSIQSDRHDHNLSIINI